ncbi:nitric oxide synthase [Pseudomassariella vexata]|uniref:nitric-oxide synthase (NADPH) n=1 Tax=Pseudomassariella vexata TaxID=1141098 RepID=A0A1Y2EJN2_9PEZI|nr:nitric oxide synthase [Pseudomassariella vexata]ORY71769.1 nitric oxide synthase [Pseudomassariella vexata]
MSSPSCPVVNGGFQGDDSAEPPHIISSQPSAGNEFMRITTAYPNLSSTGCTAKFCQSGRMKHTDEERVGRNQPLDAIEKDAVDFLHQLRQAGMIDSEQALKKRIQYVIKEIKTNSVTARYNACNGVGSDSVRTPTVGIVGGNWSQTSQELEFGIRLAWKHSRKCIMRSEYKDLRLCDLRHITTSSAMAKELIANAQVAFNHGEIRPTVFVFPPRRPNERGPMIWNPQLFSFAGYAEDNNDILGDPMNVELTKAIIELGWKPPRVRTKWDMLPLVTMAQGEDPVITEIPKDIFPCVPIQHPRYRLAFDKLGLRWVPSPALSRLGFTIGGVQWTPGSDLLPDTASPFMGWFMDAEIGVRNLADTFRYNVLPQIIKQLGLFNGELDSLPDFERLALLSRAQLELNFAVSYSFAKAQVRMIDSLSASEVFSRFDDEHLAENGYRLPSDPYWLAPPQGSIIPLWHRGASPNFQPKPMICHHVQDPIKTWRRENGQSDIEISHESQLNIRLEVDSAPSVVRRRRLSVAFCSSGTVASKLCKKLQTLLCHAARTRPDFGCVMPIQTLNALKKSKLRPDDVLVVIASNTRQGEMPQNGQEFAHGLETDKFSVKCSFAIFGNGSRDYADTFNHTAINLDRALRIGGAASLFDPVFADTAVESPPWRIFDSFCEKLLESLTGVCRGPRNTLPQPAPLRSPAEPLLDTASWFRAHIQHVIGGVSEQGIKRVQLDIGSRTYATMSYLSLLPPNAESTVQALLSNLNIKPDERLHFASGITVEEFFRFYADLKQPFKTFDWAAEIPFQGAAVPEELMTLPILEAVAGLPTNWQHWAALENLCCAVPRIQPRKYSIASCPSYSGNSGRKGCELELLVQQHAGGRFSDIFLSMTQISSTLTCKIERATHLESMAGATDRPLIIFATGSGVAPVRGLLQHRTELVRQKGAVGNSKTPYPHAPITLFSGFKAEDQPLVREALADAEQLGLFDLLRLMPSNLEKRRAQDMVFEEGLGLKLVEKIQDNALVFVCAKPEAESDFCGNLSALLGRDVKDALGERYIADIYQPAV